MESSVEVSEVHYLLMKSNRHRRYKERAWRVYKRKFNRWESDSDSDYDERTSSDNSRLSDKIRVPLIVIEDWDEMIKKKSIYKS